MNKLLISVSEARKILGKEAKGMTDAEIEKRINEYDQIATLFVTSNKILKSSDLNKIK